MKRSIVKKNNTMFPPIFLKPVLIYKKTLKKIVEKKLVVRFVANLKLYNFILGDSHEEGNIFLKRVKRNLTRFPTFTPELTP